MRARNIQFNVRFAEPEAQALHRLSLESGLNESTVLRQLVLGGQVKGRAPEEYRRLLRELSAIGNNVNQIAHIANAAGTVSPAQVEEVRQELSKIWECVEELA